MKYQVFFCLLITSLSSYSMQENVLLLQSKEQVRNNNAREAAVALEKFLDVVLPLYPELDRKKYDESLQQVRISQLSHGQKKQILSVLEVGTKYPWALPVLDTDELRAKRSKN